MPASLLEAPESREIRVFLSSTFRDFNEERKLLATQVFPELNRRARERGVELVEVDLRWGVTQQQAEDGHALEICLQQIERCKPYFIGMLGDSYGSLTPPQRQLLQAAPDLLDKRQWLDGRIGEASYTELEIEHSLQLLRVPAMTGKAFFYFRDASYSNPKAAAGELGWRSDEPADRQKLELLKEKIRSSEFPLTQGLKNPQEIADQIKADLWALIDQQFPAGEQPNALEKEARKHADYRRSRTGAGQYIGGQGSIAQLEQWIEEGQQQILITGESGAGKSALIANWMAAHETSHPDDLLYAHHLGCTNDANALRPLLGRLIDTASAQLLEVEVITEALPVPDDWWELVAKVAETLHSLGRWCEQCGKRWIWVLDGLDRLEPDDQNALPWLSQNLPVGVNVVASALACPARTILSERGYSILMIEPLVPAEQEQLIQRYLQRYTKELDGGLRQHILNHSLAGSPLFLKVLLEELRQCGRHDTLKEQLAFYLSSQTIDDLYERVLERLENDGSGDTVRKVMTAIWASRAGLAETELLAITDLPQLQWAPIDLALEKAFGRNGNRLVFDHDFLRIAVKDRYLPTEEQQRQAHSELADWFGDREGGWDERDSEEGIWQLFQAARHEDLRSVLLTPWMLACLVWDRGNREVLDYWLVVKGLGDGELDELIADDLEKEIENRQKDAADLIWFVDRIAWLFAEAGLYREPLLKLRSLSLELEEASDDRSEESMLSSLQCLADAHRDLGHYDDALPLYLRTLEARELLLGPEHNDTLNTIDSLGGLYLDNGDYDQAETWFHRCLEARERILGPEHPYTLTSLNNLGLIDILKGNYAKAEGFYRKLLKSQERLLGPEDLNTLVTLFNLASLFKSNGDYEKAEAIFAKCLSSLERLLGSEHPKTLITVSQLADLYEFLGDYGQAEALYTRCLQGRELAFGAGHPDTLSTAYNLADVLSQLKRHAEAIPLRRRELVWCRERNGDIDPGTLTSINGLAIDLRETSDLEEAETLFRELVTARQQVLEPEDFQIGRALGGLAKTLEAAGKLEEALSYAQHCLDHRLEHQGPDDWHTNRERLDLARVLHKLGHNIEAVKLLLELQTSMGRNDEPDDDDRQLIGDAAVLKRNINEGLHQNS